MAKELEQPTETDSIECHLQKVGMGTLICGAARHGDRTINEVDPTICFNCPAGSVFREVGCDAVLPRLRFFPYSGGVMSNFEALFCRIRKRDTTLEECRACELVPAETTKRIISTARGLFQSDTFYSAYQDIEGARKALRDGNFENAVTRSVSCLESVMRVVHEKVSEPLPKKKQLTELWKSTRSVLHFERLDETGTTLALLNSLSGVMTHLGSVRNVLSDAHGKGAVKADISESIAELALNIASTLGTMIVRRFNQVMSEKDV